MKTCPYCANDVSDIARTCTMCGMGLPENLPQRSRVLPIVIAVILVGSLAIAAFLVGEWRARNTPLVAATPTEDVPSVHQPAVKPRSSTPTVVAPVPDPAPAPPSRQRR